MSKSNTFEQQWLDHVFLNANIPNIGDATGLRGSSAAGDLYVSLHTADPGEAGTALTNELSYDEYARQAVPRSSAGFSREDSTISLVPNVDFPEMVAGAGGTMTHFAYVAQISGAAVVLYKGELDNPQVINAGVIPRLKGTVSGSATTVTED